MATSEDLKIILGVGLDKDNLNSVKKDISKLKESIAKASELGIRVKIDTSNISELRQQIKKLSEDLKSTKVKIGVELNLSDTQRNNINKKISALNSRNNLNKLKLGVDLNLDKQNINRVNKQIEQLAKQTKRLNLEVGVSGNGPVNAGSKRNSGVNNSKVSSKRNNGEEPDVDSTLKEQVSEHKGIIAQMEKNQQKLEKIQTRITANYSTLTKTFDNGVDGKSKVTFLADKYGNNEVQTSYEEIVNYQKISNNLYNEQLKITKEIIRLEKLKADATDEDKQNIKDLIYEFEQQLKANEKILASDELINNELQERINYEKQLAEIKSRQKENIRQTRLGEKLDDEKLKNFDASKVFNGDADEMKDELQRLAESMHGASVTVSNLKNKIKSATYQQQQFTVSTKSSKGMVTEFTYAVDKQTGAVYKVGERTREAGRRMIDFFNDLNIAFHRLIEWNSVMAGMDFIIGRFSEGVGFIKQLDNELTQVAMVTGQTREEVQGLTQDYIDMAKATSKTVAEISSVNTELTRQGLSPDESSERLETILKLSSVASMDVNDTLSVITSSVNALGESAEHTADVLVKAGNTSASSVAQIGTAMQKVASSAKATGTSIEQLTGMTATLIDVTQEAPETLGNSLKSMMARYTKINELGEENEDLNDVAEAYKHVGIAFTDAQGQIRPFYELLSEMAEKWTTLDTNTKAYVATMSAGAMQGNRFLALMENWDRVASITNNLEVNSSGTLAESYDVWADSVEASLNRITIAWEEMYASLLSSDLLIGLFEDISSLVSALTPIFDKMTLAGMGVATAIVWTMTKTGMLKNLFEGLSKVTFKAGDAMMVLNTMLNRTRTTTDGAIVSENLLDVAIKKLNITTAVDTATQIGRAKALGLVIGKTVVLATVTTGLMALMSAGAGLITGALVGGFNSFLGITKKTTESIEDLISTSKENITTHGDTIKSLSKMSDEFTELQSKVEKYGSVLKLTEDEQTRYNELANELAGISPSIVQAYDEKGNAILRYGTKIEDLIEKEKALIDIENQRIIGSAGDLTQEVQKEISNIQKEIAKAQAEYVNISLNYQYDTSTPNGQKTKSDLLTEKLEQKRAEMDVLREIIQNQKDYSEQVVQDAIAKLGKLEGEYSTFLAKQQVANAEIAQNKAKLNDIANAKISNAFDSLDISDKAKKLGGDFVLDIFSKAIDEDIATSQEKLDQAIYIFTAMFGQLDEALKAKGSEGADQYSYALQGLVIALENLGIPAEQAQQWVHLIAGAMLDGKTSTDAFAESLSKLSELFNKDMDEIDNLQDIMAKLSKQERITRKELEYLIGTYEGLAEYIAETGDLTLDNGNKIQELLDKKMATLDENLSKEQDLAKQEQKRLESEQQRQEQYLEYCKKVYGENSKVYNDEAAKLETIKQRIAANTAELTKLNAHMQVYKLYSQQDYNEDNFDTMSDAFKEATDQLTELIELQEELSENGISDDLLNALLEKHPELIQYLNDETLLYEKICEKIKEMEGVQAEAYSNMMANSDTFYNNMIATHEDLVNSWADMYGVDLANFTTLTQAKLAMASRMASAQSKLAVLNDKLSSGQKLSVVEQHNMEVYLKEIENMSKVGEGVSNLVGSIAQTNLNKHNFQKAGTSKSGGSKKSKSSRSKVKYVELETDAYVRLTKALEDVERQQKKNQRLIDYSSGKARIELLNKEIELLTKKQKLTNELANEYRKELKDLSDKLSKKIGLNDGTDGINNYRKYVAKKEKEINALVDKINAGAGESVQNKKDKLEEEMKEFQEMFDRYLELKTSTIPDLSDSWWDYAYEKFEHTLSMMETDLEKYSKKIELINKNMTYILQGRSDNAKVLEYEIDLMKQMSDIYQDEIANIKDRIKANSEMVDKYEKQLANIKDKQSDTYRATANHLTLARHEQEKLAEALSSALDQYSSQLNSQISKHMELLDSMKEKAIETFEAMRIELDSFSIDNFKVEMETIKAELDKIDGIFIKNPEFNLSTEDERDSLDSLGDTIESLADKINKYKNTSEKFNKLQIKDADTLNKKKEELEKHIENQIKLENQLKKEYEKLSLEIAKTELEHKKQEDAIEAMINSKKEELDAIKEQYEEESKITSMIEKRLALLRAMDDTRYTYITGQGESVFTYDVANVNALKSEIGKLERENQKEEKLNEIQKEIDKMEEDLKKTQEINDEQLKVLELQASAVKDLLDKLGDNIDNDMDKNMENIYTLLKDNYIDNMQSLLKNGVDTLNNIYKTILGRDITPSANGSTSNSDSGKTTIVRIEAGDTLEKIAKKYNTTVSKLLELNPNIKDNSGLQAGGNIKVPAQFESGGYTGEFNGGKLAVLHEKELILNKQDTSNVLKAVDIAQNISKGLLNMIPSIVNPSIINSENKECNQIIQHMEIHGVRDVNAFASEMQKMFRNGIARLS